MPALLRSYEPETVTHLARHEIRYGDRQKPYVALTFDCETGVRSTKQILETLRQNAIVESTEASNRIEGITIPADRLRALMAQAAPETRSWVR